MSMVGPSQRSVAADGLKVCQPCTKGRHEDCTLHEECGCSTCNDPEPIFEDPPSRVSPGRHVIPCPLSPRQIKAAVANPKRWMRVDQYPKKTTGATFVSKIQKGKYPELAEHGEWKATSRRNPDGTSMLWACYVGPSKKENG